MSTITPVPPNTPVVIVTPPPSAVVTIETDVKAELTKVTTEVSFLKANWGKVSAAIIAVAVVAFLLRGCF